MNIRKLNPSALSSQDDDVFVGGNEDFKDGARGEGCASPEQRSYPHWRELPIYPDRSRFYHDGTHFSHLSSPPAPPRFV